MYDEQQVVENFENKVTELFNLGQELFEIAKVAEEKHEWESVDTLLDHALNLQKEAVRCTPQSQMANRIRIYRAAIKTAICRRKYQEAKLLVKEVLAEIPQDFLDFMEERKDLEETYCILEHTAC